jgi:hypothetical protein
MLPDDLLNKIKEVFEAEMVAGGRLYGVKWIDWGYSPPPLASTEFPIIFITIERAMYPMVVAARGAEEAYDEHYWIAINVASYIVETASRIGGYKATFTEAMKLMRSIRHIAHENKKWDGLCYSSEFSEEEDEEWGVFPLDRNADNIAFGITAILHCRSRSRASSSSSSSSST